MSIEGTKKKKLIMELYLIILPVSNFKVKIHIIDIDYNKTVILVINMKSN